MVDVLEAASSRGGIKPLPQVGAVGEYRDLACNIPLKVSHLAVVAAGSLPVVPEYGAAAEFDVPIAEKPGVTEIVAVHELN